MCFTYYMHFWFKCARVDRQWTSICCAPFVRILVSCVSSGHSGVTEHSSAILTSCCCHHFHLLHQGRMLVMALCFRPQMHYREKFHWNSADVVNVNEYDHSCWVGLLVFFPCQRSALLLPSRVLWQGSGKNLPTHSFPLIHLWICCVILWDTGDTTKYHHQSWNCHGNIAWIQSVYNTETSSM